MTDDQKRLLAVFEVRVHDLVAECERRNKLIDELSIKLASKDDELKQAIQTIEELRIKYDSLVNAQVVSINGDDLKNAKLKLSKLVREVDKCIALLNE